MAFSKFDEAVLRRLIKGVDRPFVRMLEVGSWLGTGSTRVFIDELRGRGVLYCVDTWKGNANVERHQTLVAQYDVFATFQRNVALGQGQEIVKPLMMTSLDAAQILRDGTFDLVFIDGDHSYQATTEDIAAWTPKVRRGGILCGHDCEARPESLGRNHLWRHRFNDTIEVDRYHMAAVHPGVVLAVDEAFGGSAYLWAEAVLALGDGSRGSSSIWARGCQAGPF